MSVRRRTRDSQRPGPAVSLSIRFLPGCVRPVVGDLPPAVLVLSCLGWLSVCLA